MLEVITLELFFLRVKDGKRHRPTIPCEVVPICSEDFLAIGGCFSIAGLLKELVSLRLRLLFFRDSRLSLRLLDILRSRISE